MSFVLELSEAPSGGRLALAVCAVEARRLFGWWRVRAVVAVPAPGRRVGDGSRGHAELGQQPTLQPEVGGHHENEDQPLLHRFS
jgi:hypothetical protein